MGFAEYKDQQGVELLQRSLRGGRLAHGYLFAGQDLDTLEGVARALAKTLNCHNPIRDKGATVDCCDTCPSCRKTAADNHPNVHWVRPESKSRLILIEQIRELMQRIQLKAGDGERKIGIIVAADRLNDKSANAFLKTLEEPPPGSVLILLTTEPQQIIETILSRCLRLTFGAQASVRLDPASRQWIESFSTIASGKHKSLISRYRVLDSLLQRLGEIRAGIEQSLAARSPLGRYQDAEKELIEKWEEELKAAVESDYRRHRFDLLAVLQWWLRDVWLRAIGGSDALLTFPNMKGPGAVAGRITPDQALENLQTIEDLQWLLQNSNVQEALALEVKLLKLNL